MKLIYCAILLLLLPFASSSAQSPESYRGLLTARVRSEKPPAPAHLQAYVQDGKLTLSLRDAIRLALENNSNISLQETQIEYQKFNLLSAHQPFDPQLQSTLNINRYSTPSYSQLQGVGVSSNVAVNALSQTGQVALSQTFTTGTNVQASLSSGKSSTNSSYDYFNPYFSSTFLLQFTQPLLQNAGRFANTAQLVIARRSLAQSRSSFEAEVNDAILQAVNQYWYAVQARGTLEVQKKSLNLAQVSYERDKRALELGALPPLDIYRSESEVAARKVQVIQAGYALTQAEDALRLTIGANQDPQFRFLELNLTEQPQPQGSLQSIALEPTLALALSQRPEIEVVKDALENDRTSIRLAHNQLKPNLSLTGFYQSSGLGGNEYNLTTGQLVAPGGFGSSMNQTFGFGYPGYGGTLTLNLPIRNRGGQARLGSALVSRSHDMYSARQIQEQIAQEVSDAVHQLEEAKQALEAGNISFDLAQKSLSSDQRKYELGAETNFFVLDSQTKLAAAELTLLQTQVNYQVALAAVSHATASLLDPYHLKIAELSK
ncbi:MAG: TolC family protein [Terracidiphilus sp.]|jgi:outer membrane protein